MNPPTTTTMVRMVVPAPLDLLAMRGLARMIVDEPNTRVAGAGPRLSSEVAHRHRRSSAEPPPHRANEAGPITWQHILVTASSASVIRRSSSRCDGISVSEGRMEGDPNIEHAVTRLSTAPRAWYFTTRAEGGFCESRTGEAEVARRISASFQEITARRRPMIPALGDAIIQAGPPPCRRRR